jgi:hypothetical protein
MKPDVVSQWRTIASTSTHLSAINAAAKSISQGLFLSPGYGLMSTTRYRVAIAIDPAGLRC